MGLVYEFEALVICLLEVGSNDGACWAINWLTEFEAHLRMVLDGAPDQNKLGDSESCFQMLHNGAWPIKLTL